jgi:hypothetical protein
MVLADRTKFVLDDDTRARFAAALDCPAEAKPAVLELMSARAGPPSTRFCSTGARAGIRSRAERAPEPR